MSKDILEEIIAHKRIEIAAQEQNVPISFLEDLLEKNDDMAKVHSMKASLAASATGIIAEFKRRSPSKDWINRNADAKVIPASYQQLRHCLSLPMSISSEEACATSVQHAPPCHCLSYVRISSSAVTSYCKPRQHKPMPYC